MTNAYTVTGTLTDGRTVNLDEALPLRGGKVRVTVEVVSPPTPPRESLQKYLADLRQRQAARGHVPLTVQEVESYIKAERDSWGD